MSKLSKDYSKKKSETQIHNRYTMSMPSIRLTLEKLNSTSHFQKTKENLRQKGWKDWHILMGIFNFALSYRGKILGLYRNSQQAKVKRDLYLKTEENRKSVPIPIVLFTQKNIEFALNSSLPSTLESLGFKIKGKLNVEELSKYLGEKFNYWTDDIPHENLFD